MSAMPNTLAQTVVLPSQARIRQLGNTRPDGSFSFWTNGVIGDWFIAAEAEQVRLTVEAMGKTIKGVSPLMGVELVSGEGDAEEVGRISIVSSQYRAFSLDVPVQPGFFGVRLRHLNRVADKKTNALRHLLLKRIALSGATLSDCELTEHLFFGQAEAGISPAGAQTVSTKSLVVQIDPRTARWTARHVHTDCSAEGVRPVFHIKGLPVDLSRYAVECSVAKQSSHKLDACTKVELCYHKDDALAITYALLVSETGGGIIAQVDFTNNTGRKLIVNRIAPMVAPTVCLGGNTDDWSAIGDEKRFSQAYKRVDVGEMKQLESWWYTALKSQATGYSVLAGNVTNNKGLGRFLLLPGSDTSVKLAAYNDYEGIVMPPGATVIGEKTLLHFGYRGTDSMDRLGELIAKAHDIDLMKQHPIDPYVPETLGSFTTWNGYGSAVVRGFDYQHDRSKGDRAFMDREWVKANWKKVRELGLGKYGYGARGKVRGAPTPLARRYGNPDFWFKEAQEIAKEHPEYYLNGRVDFSNPAVQEFERQRVEQAFARAKGHIVRYGWDFADRWRKLPGQYDPFMTSAETYHIAMGIWREAARKHPQGAYAFVWMNAVGISYDTCDVIHIGADSDQGYYGRGCTFEQGLTRQISGRYFYNGRVWWNSPDSFHVHCGGIYSYQQAKVHASFCAISGNLVHLGEPLTDQETPEDRLEIIRRVSPTTHDVATAVDVFDHCPARLWNMPISRPFGKWNVVGLFNVDYGKKGEPITQEIAFEDLDLSPDKDYLVYEFWSKQFLGVKKGRFTRTLQAPDCEIYSIVERKGHPVLISTNRHVRHLAYDILDLSWDGAASTLKGTSKVVQDDPYQLRVFVPEEYSQARVNAGGLEARLSKHGQIVIVDFESPESKDVEWRLVFR